MNLNRTNHSHIFIPGWATDQKIVNTHLSKQVHCMAPINPQSQEELTALIKNTSTPLHIIGFSLGAMLAIETATKHPEHIASLTAIGIRQQYPKTDILDLRQRLKQNKSLALKQFYKACFNTAQAYKQFKTQLEARYLNSFSEKNLLYGLDLLQSIQITESKLNQIPNLRLIHGKDDHIAPYSEWNALIKEAPSLNNQSIDTGHIPFFQDPTLISSLIQTPC